MMDDNTAMSAPRFFCPLPLAAGTRLALPAAAARHAVRALRLGDGDALTLFDGGGGEYPARIVGVAREAVEVELAAHVARECESPLDLTLLQALQSGDKMDLTIQKAVELGVARVVPLLSRRSVVRLEGERALRRVEHWRGIAVSACEQCGRNRVPAVEPIERFERWVAQATQVAQVAPTGVRRLLLDPLGGRTLASLPPPAAGERIELLIGAEGGLAPEELDSARRAGFVGIRLGPRVLRTETAGLAALAALQCLWGDFNGGAEHV